MKLPFMLAAVAAATLALPTSAALPPEWQRVAELKAILASNDLVKAFQGRMIDRIEFVRHDLYRVTAGECFALVSIKEKPLPDNMDGARKFDVVPGEVDCPTERE
ncbi:MAG TPA: hypothetical protein PKD99_11815 [Sphingopyxis sp.]|nr:hypothetical protein [Sphingopyxis sp.]HMP45785.1 hypothetical protein [Sphingopyxis sp.]HMQ19501.1 hypothetical protein [Sphingopyxis sp.]